MNGKEYVDSGMMDFKSELKVLQCEMLRSKCKELTPIVISAK